MAKGPQSVYPDWTDLISAFRVVGVIFGSGECKVQTCFMSSGDGEKLRLPNILTLPLIDVVVTKCPLPSLCICIVSYG